MKRKRRKQRNIITSTGEALAHVIRAAALVVLVVLVVGSLDIEVSVRKNRNNIISDTVDAASHGWAVVKRVQSAF